MLTYRGMISYTKRQIKYLLKVDFIRFCIVGGTGFVINLFLLTLLNQALGAPVFVSQFVAAEIALFSNFILHHKWTYKKSKTKKTIRLLLVQFHATSWPAIIGSALMVDLGVRLLNLSNFLALVISSAIALFWNFAWSKYIVWRNVTN